MGHGNGVNVYSGLDAYKYVNPPVNLMFAGASHS